MLEHLRQRVSQALASARQVTLATFGPAEIQASIVPCEARELFLYLLVPRTADHLYNLEHDGEVTAITPHWEARGRAHVLRGCERPADLALTRVPEATWSEVVEVSVERINLNATGERSVETIDVD